MIARRTPGQMTLSMLQWAMIIGMIPALHAGAFWLVGVLSLSNFAVQSLAKELRERDTSQAEFDSLRAKAKDYEQRMLLAETRASVLEARNIVIERELKERA